ncbi:MAG: ABC transporter permease [Negativicutes bacterium]
MARNIVRKLLMMIPILFLVSIILFTLMQILPGDAAYGLGPDLDEAYIAQYRHAHGLDRPAYEQYLTWVNGMLHGDFGNSLISNQPIVTKIKMRLPVTVELALLSMIIAVIIAIPAGIISALKRNSALDTVISVVSMLGVSMPPFWLGMLLILLFSLTLHWLPASGYVSFSEDPLRNLARMFMPALAIGVSFAATVTRQTRSAMLDVWDQDYIVTAKAKGLKHRVVVFKHALRNAFIPVITTIAMQVGRLFGGAVVIETVFAMPGIGKEIVNSILGRDYPVVMALIMIVAFIVVVINTFIDAIYVLIDPRLSHSK